MSAEYYGMETEEAPKHGIDKDCLNNKLTTTEEDEEPKTTFPNEKLQEIVGNVNWAENRCNNLTNCLDNLKNYYGYQKDENLKLFDNKNEFNNSEKKPQVPQRVFDEKPDAAMTTVSNILNLLTTTVNKLDTQNKFSHDKKISEMELEYAQKYKTTETSTNDIFEKSTTIINIDKSDRNIMKPIKQSIKKKRMIEKSFKGPNPSTLTMTKKKSLKPYRSVTNRLYVKRNNIQGNDKKTVSQQKLIQLYRNDELKGSDSDETQTKPTKSDNITVPPIKIPHQENHLLSKRSLAQTEYYISKAHSYDESKLTRTELNYYSRNYELPTVASRMKRVTRSYFNRFNFKAIPFCVARSTSPSHNIGINIQQFMNLLKTRQPMPMRGLSRTLTHNIELAAERLNGQPLASLVSTAVSKLGIRCPLLKSNINYQHLQEMTKSIPEELIEPPEENTNETPTVRSVVITGPAGDVKIKKRKTPKWSKVPSTDSTCTCLPKEGVGFNQVMYKQSCAHNKVASNFKITERISPMVKESQKMFADATQNNNSLNFKQKSLKNVLTNLHNEFEAMHKKFNQLSTNEPTPEVVLELEKLEKELNNKEQEITMVVTLYKELMALKEQMKKLQQPTTTSNQKISEYTNTKTTFHLTKLLKQIQQYQINYKKI